MSQTILKSRGFTIVELAISLTIIGILLALAMGAGAGWLQSARLRTNTDGLLTGLREAKAFAVSRNVTGGVWLSLVDRLDDSCELSDSSPTWITSLGNPFALLDEIDCTVEPSNNPAVAPFLISKWAPSGGLSPDITIEANRSQVRFDSFGRPVDPATGLPSALLVRLSHLRPDGGACVEAGCELQIQISVGGQIRYCDPHMAVGTVGRC